MATDFFVIALLVASLAAFVFVWLRLRALGRRLQVGAQDVSAAVSALEGETVAVLAELSKRVAELAERLEAAARATEAGFVQGHERMAPLLEDLARASRMLGEARVELGRAVERIGARSAGEDAARAGDPAWLQELARAHLVGLGIGSVSVDGVSARPDASYVVRARGLRGNELWTGSVVIRGGKVESATAAAARMFP